MKPTGPKPQKAVKAAFYRTAKGNEPVRDFLDSLTASDRKSIGGDIAQVEWKWPGVRKPLIDGFGKGLFEVRSNIQNRIARVFFAVVDGQMILLHGVVKKTQKADQNDIVLAMNRFRDWKASNP